MNATGTVAKRIRRLFDRARELSELRSSWPSRRRCEMPAPPSRTSRDDDRLIEFCLDARSVARHLEALGDADAELFRGYFIEGQAASRLARGRREALWKTYDNLERLAEGFLSAATGDGSCTGRDRCTGRFRSRTNRCSKKTDCNRMGDKA